MLKMLLEQFLAVLADFLVIYREQGAERVSLLYEEI